MAKTTEELLEQALEQNSELTKQVGSLTDQIQALTEQVAYLTRKLYGSHSEKLVDPNQLSLLEDSSVFTDPEQTGEQSEEAVVTSTQRKAKRRRVETIDVNLPVEETVIERESSVCEHGHQLIKVGKHFVRQVDSAISLANLRHLMVLFSIPISAVITKASKLYQINYKVTGDSSFTAA